MKLLKNILHLGVIGAFAIISIASLESQTMAGNTTASTKATATITGSCQISATNVNFGELSATSGSPASLWATGGVQAQCTKNSSYNVQLSMGNNADANNWRRMTGANSGALIQYTLCQTQGATGVVGSANGGCNVPWRGTSFPLTSTGTGATQTFPVYGWSSTGFFTPDTYTDSIVATINF
jgi:spore coat protein U-like protein